MGLRFLLAYELDSYITEAYRERIREKNVKSHL
jgi:hypothetical protein